MTSPSRFLRLLAATLALVLPAAAQFNGPGIGAGASINQPTTITSDRTLLYPGARDITLSQGDLISIHVFGQDTYSPSVRISSDGKVLLPLIGIVALDRLTITAAEELIASKLRAGGFFVDPQVTVAVTEGPNAAVTVVGEAHGIIPVTGSRRLLDILASAGGLPATASHVITINRPGLDQPLVVDLGTDPMRSALANVPVFPGDTIVVSKVGVVYVVGAFKSQGTVAMSQNTPLTLMELSALSGGPAFEGKQNDLRIIRTNGDTRTVVKVDLKRILYGRDPDPILQPNDIVFLPSNWIKASISNGSLSTSLGLISIALSTVAYFRYQ